MFTLEIGNSGQSQMHFEKQHDLGVDEAKRRVDKIAEQLEQRFSLGSEWHGDTLKVTGNGARGQIAVTGQDIRVNVKLGFAMKLLERPIRSGIQSAMDEYFV
ncbi:MAG: polyhydroxyalkanoic acid system family protein [Gammaproteobacteria bacterium]|nr:polyhydroxyalkanoic acid system family protein [Gammaproteobacteria bacterium]